MRRAWRGIDRNRGRALGPGTGGIEVGPATGGRFSELAVVVIVVMVMSLVVVAMVFVVSVEGSHGVVDHEGRARACANG